MFEAERQKSKDTFCVSLQEAAGATETAQTRGMLFLQSPSQEAAYAPGRHGGRALGRLSFLPSLVAYEFPHLAPDSALKHPFPCMTLISKLPSVSS